MTKDSLSRHPSRQYHVVVTDFFPVAGRPRADYLLAILGCVLVVTALVIIWGARLTVSRSVYVSELGATGEPTAGWFQVALLLIVGGGSLIAWAGRHIRTLAPLLRACTPAISLWIGCAFFFVASQVPCTIGCPMPYGPRFNWQDFTHTTVAILAFGAACLAMVQVSFAVGHRSLRWFSLACGATVAVVAGAGGLLSLLHFHANFGSVLELAATTVALGWLAAFGVAAGRRSGMQKFQQSISESDQLMDLVVVPVHPFHARLGVDGHKIDVLLPHDERAFGA